ncbi:MAG: DedA family protein [Firmicutes bacterium]|nr:DedA family protein [Bacillota bacterium]
MDLQGILALVGQYGYVALFFCLFLGIVGLPINDESLVMLAGLTAARGLLSPVPAFLVTYAGVLCGMNIGFVLGRFLGSGLLDWLCARSPRTQHHVDRARGWIAGRGPLFIWVTYYIPGVRHVVPYLLGIGNMPYWRFALIAFSGALVWTSIFYVVGYAVGDNLTQVAAMLHRYGLYAGVAAGVIALAVWAVHRRKGAGISS